MKTSVHTNQADIIRQASRYTMHGLIDPRWLEPAEQVDVKDSWVSKVVNYFSSLLAIG